MVPSTPARTRPVRFFPSRVGCWRAAARSGFTPRGAGNPGRHQLRLLSATRAGPGHAPVRTSCGRPRARSAARPPGDGILVPAGDCDRRTPTSVSRRNSCERAGSPDRSVFDAGDCGQQMPGRAGRKSLRPRTVTRLHTRTKLPALTPSRTRRPQALCQLGRGDRNRGERVTRGRR
jgi:hypothetical protein